MSEWLHVLVPTPAHAGLGPVLTYRSAEALAGRYFGSRAFGQAGDLGRSLAE